MRGLGWRQPAAVARRHPGGASLAITAPYDQLFLATEVNEWALCAALIERDPVRWDHLEETLVADALDAPRENSANPAPISRRSSRNPPRSRASSVIAALEAQPKLRALLDVSRDARDCRMCSMSRN